ncbi:TetR/AcrR family transcriptional regulator [Rhodococcus gannanensis]|uniref:TetR/AcrR family transcriptional regulator n=1 Tax=Rhodococcus gannanensis TaxID=1960308 RepID=A0ABW4PA93_9NOCA
MTGRTDWLTGTPRREAATDRILTAAAAVLAERGFDAVTVDAVVDRAGCSRATLYRYLGGRQAILDGVIARAATEVADRVSAAVDGLDGADRVVEAILVSVGAVRSNPALGTWFTGSRSRTVDDYLASSTQLGALSATLTGLGGDEAGSRWIVRVVLTLLTWPLPDAETERETVRRFVAPAFS